LRFPALLLLLLTACSTVKDESAVQVVWQKVDDPNEACREVSGRRELFRIAGCSKWSEAGGQRTCTIYASTPRDERDKERFATLGHELMHCTDGAWHDRWGRMNDERVRQARRNGEVEGSAAAGGSTP
jgi:hypothetical protein